MLFSSLAYGKRLSIISLFSLTIGLLGCGAGTSTLNAPDISMNLPVTLTGVVTTPSALTSKIIKQDTFQIETAAEDCSFPGASQPNWMENGYTMTTFLVGLSQSQSCVADMVITGVARNGSRLINQGVYTIPVAERSAGGPTHVEIQESGGAYHVWIYFNAAGEADLSLVQTMYITWSTLGTNTSGRFIMANRPDDVNDPGAPNRIRVDFIRNSETEKNMIYMGFADGHTYGLNGFRVDVSKTGSGESASYLAKGLISLSGQLPNLTLQYSPETFPAPTMSVVAYAQTDGSGAAISGFKDFAIHFGNDSYNLGSYLYSAENRTYFDSSGATKWQRFTVDPAVYVNVSELNARKESVDVTLANVETLLGLNPGYFSGVCTEVDGVICTDFIQAFFDTGMGGIGGSNDPLLTQPNDTRTAELDAAIQFTLGDLWPEGTDLDTAFNLPPAN